MLHVVDLSHPTATHSAEAALYAIADRLGFTSAIVTGGELDLSALARLQAADRAAALPEHPHNTETERLWIDYDPEFPAYVAAMQTARTKSRGKRKLFYTLIRIAAWRTNRLDTEPRFDVKEAKTWAIALARFNTDADVVAIARAGIIIACKK